MGTRTNKELIKKVREGDNQMLQLLKGKENCTAVKLPRQCPIDLL
jgi:hypothetical protein